MKRLYLGVGLVTCATLLLELLLTRIFSVTLYYHFAFLVVSIALFGLGLSGVALYLRPLPEPDELDRALARASRRFALSTIIALVYVVNHTLAAPLDANTSSPFNAQHFFQLAFLYLFSALPFYFSGLVVSLALSVRREQAATIYFFDLLGASLGCLLLDPVLRTLGGPSAVLLVVAMIGIAALLFEGHARWAPTRRSAVVLGAALALLVLNVLWPLIEIGSVKWVRREHLVFARWNAFSRIEVQKRPGDPLDMTIDGLARTVLVSLRKGGAPETLYGSMSSYRVTQLVHAVRPRGPMLIIGPGGGVDVLSALRAGHDPIWLAEINPTILYDVMLGRFRDYTGDLYAQPQIRPRLSEGRHFVRRTQERFEVVQATLVDTWAATAAGAFALTENHLYTVEAFEDYLSRLTPTGIVTMSRWVQVEGMEFVRLAALARTALERLGVREPQRHVFAAHVSSLATLLVKRTPFTDDELRALEKHCDHKGLTVLYRPGQRSNNPVWHVLGSPDPRPFYESFPVDVRPVYDDRPFFFYSVKPERAWRDMLAKTALPLNSFALRLLGALLLIVVALVVGAILVPLWLGRRGELAARRGSTLRDLLYFVCLGIGFILIEIALLQRFTLNLGHPVHSLRVVLFGMLFFGGLGSLVSSRVKQPRSLRLLLAGAALGTAGLIGAYALLLGPLLAQSIAWTIEARIALTLGLIAPPALLMGMLLPTGIRLVGLRHPAIIPWAFGLNGAASVLGSVLAMFLALHLGFTATLLVGAAIYVVALGLGLRALPRDVA